MCVSLPFWWLASTAIWIMKVLIGSFVRLKTTTTKKIKLLVRILSTAPRHKMKRFHTMPHGYHQKVHIWFRKQYLFYFTKKTLFPKAIFPNTSNVQELAKVKLLSILFFKKYEDVFKEKWGHKCLTWFNREMWIQPLGSTISNCCREEEQEEDGEKKVIIVVTTLNKLQAAVTFLLPWSPASCGSCCPPWPRSYWACSSRLIYNQHKYTASSLSFSSYTRQIETKVTRET